MTIFTIPNNFEISEGNKTLPSAFSGKTPIVNALPETALLRDGKPFFVPDFASPCVCQGSLVIRICRLGRSISARFAHRYYDAFTVGVTFTAQNLLKECQAEGLPWASATGFDGSAVVGQFLPITAQMPLAAARFTLMLDGQPLQEISPEKARFTAEEVIAHISRFHLLRQGDMIFLGSPCMPFNVSPDKRLTATIDSRQMLGFNIK